jgi:hypothetical protein
LVQSPDKKVVRITERKELFATIQVVSTMDSLLSDRLINIFCDGEHELKKIEMKLQDVSMNNRLIHFSYFGSGIKMLQAGRKAENIDAYLLLLDSKKIAGSEIKLKDKNSLRILAPELGANKFRIIDPCRKLVFAISTGETNNEEEVINFCSATLILYMGHYAQVEDRLKAFSTQFVKLFNKTMMEISAIKQCARTLAYSSSPLNSDVIARIAAMIINNDSLLPAKMRAKIADEHAQRSVVVSPKK